MNFDRLAALLTAARILPDLSRLLRPDKPFFLVGGALRDWLLGHPVTDYDFATPFDPTALAQSFARAIGGHWFFLDAARRQSRIVAGSQTYDFAPYRAADLAGDLRLRDFTINAMALPISPAGEIGGLFDPLGGRADLEKGILRACSAGVFADDPLRVLKGVRHATILGFAPEPETFTRMRNAADLLDRVAGERVRAELAAIFAAPSCLTSLSLLDRLGFWPRFLGAPAGSITRAHFRLGRMEAHLADRASDPEIASLLAEEHECGLSRAALLKFGAFLRGYEPADLAARLTVLRFGRRTAAILLALQELSPARLEEAGRLPAYPRGRGLWAAQLGNHPVDLLLFLPCLGEAPQAAWQCLLPILRDYRQELVAGRIPDLVDGGWLRQYLGIGEGKEAGALLAALRREEIAGRVRNVEQAVAFLRAQRQENSQENG